MDLDPKTVAALPRRVRWLFGKGDQDVFFDHNLRPHTVEGGVGGTSVRGTYARVWIKGYSKAGDWLTTRSLRFDLHTARELHTALGKAIEQAQVDLEKVDAHRAPWEVEMH
jgi:hypothetical protein